MRRRLLEPIWGEDAPFSDPMTSVRGLDALLEHITSARASYDEPPRLIRTGDVTLHDHPHPGPFFFTWELRTVDDRCLLEGVALGELDAEGRIASMRHGPVTDHPEALSG